MPRPLDGVVGERLGLPAYYADFLENYERASEFWKLERGQAYAEPDSENWRAFDRGDWEESMRLSEDRRAELAESERQDAARGMTSHRIRIVSLPPSDYLLWELHVLKIRDEAGEAINVLLDTEVANLEDHGQLPDINLLDTGVLYQVIYDDYGVLDHAVRYADEALVRRCRDFIAGLFGRGEPIGEFFKREIALLPPPRPARQSLPPDYFGPAGRPRSPQ
ncbi:MAG: hypothetical protein JWM19_682 [Actinomycetia bacterium]|nr:hypothetical protein [Actinomycetes bacterium]